MVNWESPTFRNQNAIRSGFCTLRRNVLVGSYLCVWRRSGRFLEQSHVSEAVQWLYSLNLQGRTLKTIFFFDDSTINNNHCKFEPLSAEIPFEHISDFWYLMWIQSARSSYFHWPLHKTIKISINSHKLHRCCIYRKKLFIYSLILIHLKSHCASTLSKYSINLR